MTFRKNTFLFYEGQVTLVFLSVAWLAFIPVFGIVLTLLFEVPCIILVVVFPKVQNEYITIDENGISCDTPKSQIWSYKWEDIAELKRSSRFRLPSMEVIPKNSRLHAPSNHYFQLSKKAKEALKKYKPTEIST